MFFKKRDPSINMTIPKALELHGIVIRKVPTGKYISVMQDMNDLPQRIVQACFPNLKLDEILEKAKTADRDFLLSLIPAIMTGVPDIVTKVLSEFLEVEPEVLLALTPSELLDVVEKWWELNDLTNFFSRVLSKVKPKLKTIPTGFSAGLQQEKHRNQ